MARPLILSVMKDMQTEDLGFVRYNFRNKKDTRKEIKTEISPVFP